MRLHSSIFLRPSLQSPRFASILSRLRLAFLCSAAFLTIHTFHFSLCFPTLLSSSHFHILSNLIVLLYLYPPPVDPSIPT
ncbi:hypothetical protein C8R46DRAFT_1115755 [Mycena filopes]|nr:hypothetical protein C8R46DRAFT_1115755 [Mycena filopes]